MCSEPPQPRCNWEIRISLWRKNIDIARLHPTCQPPSDIQNCSPVRHDWMPPQMQFERILGDGTIWNYSEFLRLYLWFTHGMVDFRVCLGRLDRESWNRVQRHRFVHIAWSCVPIVYTMPYNTDEYGHIWLSITCILKVIPKYVLVVVG